MDCREKILSNDYADFLFSERQLAESGWRLEQFCLQRLSGGMGIAYLDRALTGEMNLQTYGYISIPKLFVPADTGGMEASGILRIRERERLGLRGRGVLIGIVDTGIDYRHPAFLDEAGHPRILRIWDQTVQAGNPPEGFYYGTEYRGGEIAGALASGDPLSAVPVTDADGGHGTFLASVAAGRADPDADFVGAASEASLAVVRLKPAKPYLREFYFAGEEETVYQENDILAGIQYLLNLERELRMPTVILCGLESNNGDHAGDCLLSRMYNLASLRGGVAAVIPAGNETNRAHHYVGNIREEGGWEEAEIRVPDGTKGFFLELWAGAPEQYTVGIRSPGGERIPQIPARLNGGGVYRLILDATTVYVDYRIVEPAGGSQLIFLRFRDPAPGVWTVRVSNDYHINGVYHMWLPVTGLAKKQPEFLRPGPDVTLNSPSAASGAIAAAAYDHRTGGIYLHSGRGFTRTGGIKPDIAAPGVNVYGALPDGRYGTKTGTSAAAAHVAGAAALLLEWGIVRGNRRNMSSGEVRAYLIRGALRSADIGYPSPVWGYGTLNLYRVFTTLGA